ncbi:MAG: alkaline phosphatase, partial [Bacteroidia bacterium]|nr:alkaline phosphatase [Bacteroidia bacterium]
MITAAIAIVALAGTPDITLEFLGRTTSGGYDVSAAEVVAYDPATQRAFVVNALANAVDLVDLSDPSAPVRVGSISLLPFGGGLQSVATRNGLVALAVEAIPKTDPGKVVFMDTSGTIITAVTVGALPDHVSFTPDGTRLVVC